MENGLLTHFGLALDVSAGNKGGDRDGSFNGRVLPHNESPVRRDGAREFAVDAHGSLERQIATVLRAGAQKGVDFVSGHFLISPSRKKIVRNVKA